MKHRLSIGIALALWLGMTGSASAQDSPRILADGRQPQAAVDQEGTVWLVYGRDRTIWLQSSTDQGQSFSEPRQVTEVPAMNLGQRRGPRIGVADGALVVTCIAGQQA